MPTIDYLRCSRCGSRCSPDVLAAAPQGLIVRAWVECPVCLSKNAGAHDELKRALASRFQQIIAEADRINSPDGTGPGATVDGLDHMAESAVWARDGDHVEGQTECDQLRDVLDGARLVVRSIERDMHTLLELCNSAAGIWIYCTMPVEGEGGGVVACGRCDGCLWQARWANARDKVKV